mmetsp:Transcript_100820/g.225130  ORF Transcript_100820/g.225130 Transcript_100820/m.225130 type:complete len:208 (+) Transcript_100820:1172-1795(+)
MQGHAEGLALSSSGHCCAGGGHRVNPCVGACHHLQEPAHSEEGNGTASASGPSFCQGLRHQLHSTASQDLLNLEVQPLWGADVEAQLLEAFVVARKLLAAQQAKVSVQAENLGRYTEELFQDFPPLHLAKKRLLQGNAEDIAVGSGRSGAIRIAEHIQPLSSPHLRLRIGSMRADYDTQDQRQELRHRAREPFFLCEVHGGPERSVE